MLLRTMGPAVKGKERIRPRHLECKAVVYVRQSKRQQVQENRESTRLQYRPQERARELGWSAKDRGD